MAKRFFKFTDGERTVFRATSMVRGFRYGWTQLSWVGFSNSPVNARATTFPAVEIDDIEFRQLVALKKARVIAAGGDNQRESSPQDAWVFNSQLEAEEPCAASVYLARYGNLVGFRP
jgi:hypothetical protein